MSDGSHVLPATHNSMTLQTGIAKGKVVSVHTMRAQRGSRGMAPLILNPCARQNLIYQHHEPATLPPIKNPSTH